MAEINVGSKGKYDAIKMILLGAMTMFIGPAVMGAVMNAMTEGDTTRYLMAIGLMALGAVFVLIYVFLTHEEEEEPAPKKAKKVKKAEPVTEDKKVDEEE